MATSKKAVKLAAKAVKPKTIKASKPVQEKGESSLVGRPSSFKCEYAEQARKLCLLGATDAELANFFGVVESTINLWKLEYSEFSESLRAGKEIADADVAEKLLNRAMGYSHAEDDIRVVNGQIVITPTIKHYPPDTPAAIHWLNNRQKSKWRSKVDSEVSGPDGGPIEQSVKVKFV